MTCGKPIQEFMTVDKVNQAISKPSKVIARYDFSKFDEQ